MLRNLKHEGQSLDPQHPQNKLGAHGVNTGPQSKVASQIVYTKPVKNQSALVSKKLASVVGWRMIKIPNVNLRPPDLHTHMSTHAHTQTRKPNK